MSLKRLAASAATILFFAVQMAIPLRLWLLDRRTTSTDFSWDMFAYTHTCQRMTIAATDRHGKRLPVPLDDDFHRRYQLFRVGIYPGRLADYAHHLCRVLAPEVASVTA